MTTTNKNLIPRERKYLARLKTELKKLEDKAYKTDGLEIIDSEKFNSRYDAKVKEINKLINK